MSIEAMKQALEWIEAQPEPRMIGAIRSINALHKAIKQAQKQEPVAWDGKCVLGHCGSPSGCEDSHCCRADYTTPPQRQPLTDDQIAKIASTPCAVVGSYVHTFARAIEAAHGIKGEEC